MDWFPILLGSLLMFGLGFWDDLKPIGARSKLIGQITIALLVYSLGFGIDKVTYPRGEWNVDLGGWSLVVTVFWLIAVPNIINLIDGFDGLATGLGLFMAVTLGIVGIMSEQHAVAWYGFAMAGALLGFLVFNFPPAKIFLGDGGAYLIGFSIAALSIKGSHKGSIAAVLLVTIVALGVPILDTSLALLRRAFRGFPLFHADGEHIHHRLQDLGFSQRRIVLGMYGVCVVLSLIGLSIFWSQGQTLPIAIGAVFLLAIFALRYLNYFHTFAEAQAGWQLNKIIVRRRLAQYALLQARLMEMEVERCHEADEFRTIFSQSLGRVGLIVPPGESGANYVVVEVKFSSSNPWILYAPTGTKKTDEWQRVAECFRPAYIKALQKWEP
jgi:UDP-GlcNAc:undecaprenyl-phosphate GlcNAc-1-phosphate transferase